MVKVGLLFFSLDNFCLLVYVRAFEVFLRKLGFFLFSLANHFQTIGFSFVIFIGLNEYIRTHFLFSFLFRRAKLFCALIFIYRIIWLVQVRSKLFQLFLFASVHRESVIQIRRPNIENQISSETTYAITKKK